MRWKNSWLQTSLPQRLSTDAEVNPTCTVHSEIKHLGVANTMAEIRKEWWIPKLRSKVKKMVNACNVCKVFSTKPYRATATAGMPQFRVETSRPFETTGGDFAGPTAFKIAKKEQGKCHILLFT